VLKVGADYIHAKAEIDIEIDTKAKLYWGLVKDDISPNDIFRLQKGSAEDRKLIAQYCIQDCVLVSKTYGKAGYHRKQHQHGECMPCAQ